VQVEDVLLLDRKCHIRRILICKTIWFFYKDIQFSSFPKSRDVNPFFFQGGGKGGGGTVLCFCCFIDRHTALETKMKFSNTARFVDS